MDTGKTTLFADDDVIDNCTAEALLLIMKAIVLTMPTDLRKDAHGLCDRLLADSARVRGGSMLGERCAAPIRNIIDDVFTAAPLTR